MFGFGSKRRQVSVPAARTNETDRVSPDSSGIPSPSLPGQIKSDFLNDSTRYFETFIQPSIALSRSNIRELLLLVAVLLQAGGYFYLLPLKERIPFIAEFNEQSGKLEADDRFKVLGVENVQDKQIYFFTRQWVKNLWTIDSQLRVNLPKTANWVRGAATNELSTFIDKDKAQERLVRDPNITRELVKKPSITAGAGKTLFVHLELAEKVNGVEVRRLRKLIQLDYELLSEVANDDENPIGLVFVHFAHTDE